MRELHAIGPDRVARGVRILRAPSVGGRGQCGQMDRGLDTALFKTFGNFVRREDRYISAMAEAHQIDCQRLLAIEGTGFEGLVDLP